MGVNATEVASGHVPLGDADRVAVRYTIALRITRLLERKCQPIRQGAHERWHRTQHPQRGSEPTVIRKLLLPEEQLARDSPTPAHLVKPAQKTLAPPAERFPGSG